jgi:flagellar export protein FliJ
MRFEFSLETVLRVARIHEESEWKKLQAMQAEMQTIVAELQSIEQAQIAVRKQLRTDIAGTMPAGWWQVFEDRIAALKARAAALGSQLSAARERCDAQQQVYIAARQKREVLASLRAARYDQFRHELERREQIAIDDVFLNRYR